MKRHKHLDSLFPFAIRTSKGYFVVLQCRDVDHAKQRYAAEESHRGNITSVTKVT